MGKGKNGMKEIVEIEGVMIIGKRNMKMIESTVMTETGLTTGEGMSVPEEGKIMIMEEEGIGVQGIEMMKKEVMKDIVVTQIDDLVTEREANGKTEDRLKEREETRTGEVEDLAVLGMKGMFIINK